MSEFDLAFRTFQRENNCENRSARRPIPNSYAPPVLLDYAVYDRETESRAFARAFSRKERFENFCDDLGRDPWP